MFAPDKLTLDNEDLQNVGGIFVNKVFLEI